MLLDQMKESLTAAMKSGEKDTALTLRSIMATLHNEKIKKGDILTDDEVVKSLKTEMKKRDEALEAYKGAGREESAANEQREKELIASFLPEQLSEEDLGKIIDEVIASAEDQKNFGLLMKAVMAKVGNQADGGAVSKALKEKIG